MIDYTRKTETLAMATVPIGYVCITIERYEELIDSEIRQGILIESLSKITIKAVKDLLDKVFGEERG